MQMLKYLLLFTATIATCAAEARVYNVIPSSSQSQYYRNQCSVGECINNTVTLSQLTHNSGHYFMEDTRLIFSPGNHSLESEVIAENIHSFFMLSWPLISSKALITCSDNARFVFRNVSIVTLSGLNFVGCFENHVVSIDQFQIENF